MFRKRRLANQIVVPCVQHVVRCNAKVNDENRAHWEDVLSRIFVHRTLQINVATSGETSKCSKALLKLLVEQAKQCLVLLLTSKAGDVPQRLVQQKRTGHVDFAMEWSSLEELLYGRRKTIRKGVSVRSLKRKLSARQPHQPAKPSSDASTLESAQIRQLEEENRHVQEEKRRWQERAENAEAALAHFRRQHKEHMEWCDAQPKPASATTEVVSSLAVTFADSLVVSALNDAELLHMKLHEISGETQDEVRDIKDPVCLELLEDLPNDLKREVMTYTSGDPFNTFQLVRHLGRGGFGNVNQARLTRDFAVKEIAIEDTEHLQEIVREGQRSYKLSHPKLLSCLYRYISAQTLHIYLVHPLMEKGDVEQILKRLKRPLTEPEAAQLVKDLLQALNFLHEKDIAHRDVKPQNLLVNANCEGKLADMGLAADASRKRQTGVGSPGYMGPEVIMAHRTGKEYEGRAADAYATGVTLFTMVIGCEPFVSTSIEGIFSETMSCKVCDTGSEIAKKAGIVLSKECREFIRSCLHYRPDDRASIGDLLDSNFIRKASIDALKAGLAGI